LAKGAKNFQKYKGLSFDNETELEFYKRCEIAVEKGNISSFEFCVTYELQPEFQDDKGKKVSAITHIPDFRITLLDGDIVIVDTKGGMASNHEEVSVLKRKIWMYQNQGIPYYMISKAPSFLGQHWVNTSKGNDFLTKLRNKYKKLYPNENTREWRTCKRFLPKDWSEYFDYETFADLFYVMNKEYTKKELEQRAKGA
jgi:hypothetical protein